jgi:hypothetical protein
MEQMTSMGVLVKNAGLFIVGRVVTRAVTFARPNDTSTYTAGDIVADSTTTPTLLQFKDVVPIPGASGCIQMATVSIAASVAALQPDLQLYLYDGPFVLQGDNVAFAATNDQIARLVAIISLPVAAMVVTNAGAGAAGNVVCNAQGLVIPFNTRDSDANLYGHLVVRNAYVPVAVTQFTIRLSVVN